MGMGMGIGVELPVMASNVFTGRRAMELASRASAKPNICLIIDGHFNLAQVASTEVVLAARCRRKYANAHTYHVNSIALSSDQETFITADDLRVNLWHLDISDQAFNVVDMKPANMDELTEV